MWDGPFLGGTSHKDDCVLGSMLGYPCLRKRPVSNFTEGEAPAGIMKDGSLNPTPYMTRIEPLYNPYITPM